MAKDKARISSIKREISMLKSRIITEETRLQHAGLSERELDKLGRIIARLEEWCNNGKF